MRQPSRTRVWSRRLWPVALAGLVLGASEYAPSVELTRGSAVMRKGLEQSQVVCPTVPDTSPGRLFVSSPSGAADVRAGVLRGPAQVLGARVAALTVPTSKQAAVVTLGDASVGRTDAVLLARGAATLVTGLLGQQCQPAAASWWFVGASARFGRSDSIVLTNPTNAVAVVDIDAFTLRGREHSADSRGIGVRPRSRRIIALNRLFPGVPSAVVHISTTSGVIHAALLASQFTGTAGTGAEWLPATAPGLSVIPVAPDLSSATLYLAAERAATVSVRATGPAGSFTPLGMGSISVPAGTLVAVHASEVAPDAAALLVTSSSPVVAGLVGNGTGSARADLVAAAAVAPTVTRGQALTGLAGLASRLTVVSDPGRETVVTVALRGSATAWRRTLTLRDGDARVLWLPVQARATSVDVNVTRGSVGLLMSLRGAPSRPGTAADITLAARATTVLVRPAAQVPR
ncbi:MAG: hypothetical protein KGP01_01815 [Actinomycetales bacterium]|nr:hypothetical protein [Actinomycetales bacterium]